MYFLKSQQNRRLQYSLVPHTGKQNLISDFDTFSAANVTLLYLVDSISHSLQRELSRSIHRLAVVGWSPAGTVDVNNLRHVADG